MARIRSIRPEFFLDTDLAELPLESRHAFIGLWCEADRDGRLEDNPRRLKATIFPYDNFDMDKVLHSLTVNKPFIIRYKVEGRKYIQILNFLKHQNPHHTEKKSIIPSFNGDLTVKPPLSNDPYMDNGNMDNGKDKNKEKEEKQEKEKKEKSSPPTVDGVSDKEAKEQRKARIQNNFTLFYQVYPVKKSKEQAIKTFEKCYSEIERVGLQLIIDDVKWRTINDKQWLKEFIPHPSSYLNGKLWADEPNGRMQTAQPATPKPTSTPAHVQKAVDHYNDPSVSPEEFVRRRLED